MNHVAPIDHVSNDIDRADHASALESATESFERLVRSVHEMFSNAEEALGIHALNEGPVAEMRLRYIEACQAMRLLQEDLRSARATLVPADEPKSGRFLKAAPRAGAEV